MNRTSNLPFVGSNMGLGSRAWNQATGKPRTGPFLAAVAVFAAGVDGFLLGLSAFLIFAATMGLLVFLMSFL